MKIDASGMGFRKLNEVVRASPDREVTIVGCAGQRYLAAGLSDKTIAIEGTPGNALGAYLDGCEVTVRGNAQDAVGDTMNGGCIRIFGNAGDALGYAMRGGKIFVRGDAGYRVGIHMKAYGDRRPAIVIGGVTGSFLGEYQAGGLIVALDLAHDPLGIVGNFCGTGMHGGEMYLRCTEVPHPLPAQVKAERVERITDPFVLGVVREFADVFSLNADEILSAPFLRLTPNAENPYRRLYTNN